MNNIPAQLDIGADRSVLPEDVVLALGLAQMGSVLVAGLGGTLHQLPTYDVLVGLQDAKPQPREVLAADEPWALLGRDVLNSHRLVLDGPQLILELDLSGMVTLTSAGIFQGVGLTRQLNPT